MFPTSISVDILPGLLSEVYAKNLRSLCKEALQGIHKWTLLTTLEFPPRSCKGIPLKVFIRVFPEKKFNHSFSSSYKDSMSDITKGSLGAFLQNFQEIPTISC